MGIGGGISKGRSKILVKYIEGILEVGVMGCFESFLVGVLKMISRC